MVDCFLRNVTASFSLSVCSFFSVDQPKFLPGDFEVGVASEFSPAFGCALDDLEKSRHSAVLRNAVDLRKSDAKGLLHHSNRGSQ